MLKPGSQPGRCLDRLQGPRARARRRSHQAEVRTRCLPSPRRRDTAPSSRTPGDTDDRSILTGCFSPSSTSHTNSAAEATTYARSSPRGSSDQFGSANASGASVDPTSRPTSRCCPTNLCRAMAGGNNECRIKLAVVVATRVQQVKIGRREGRRGRPQYPPVRRRPRQSAGAPC